MTQDYLNILVPFSNRLRVDSSFIVASWYTLQLWEETQAHVTLHTLDRQWEARACCIFWKLHRRN